MERPGSEEAYAWLLDNARHSALAGVFSGFAFFPLSPTNLKKHVNKATCDESAALSVRADGLSGPVAVRGFLEDGSPL